jgi:hypothetical protein
MYHKFKSQQIRSRNMILCFHLALFLHLWLDNLHVKEKTWVKNREKTEICSLCIPQYSAGEGGRERRPGNQLRLGEAIRRRQDPPTSAALSPPTAAAALPRLGLRIGSDRMGMASAATQEERERKMAGWGDEGAGRREEGGGREGGELAAAYVFLPLTRSCLQSIEPDRDEAIRSFPGRFQSLWVRKPSTLWMEFGLLVREFGPNSRPKFHATPNTRIRARIPEFRIPGRILSIQTGHYCC